MKDTNNKGQTVNTEEGRTAPEEKKTGEEEMDEFLQKMREMAMGIKHLSAIESDELFDKQIAKRKYVVSEIMPEGLLLLFGEPKIGKSFLVLGLCCSVAKGEPFLGYPTDKGEVLYFCYEDDEERLQKRLHSMCDEGFPGVFFRETSTSSTTVFSE